MTASPRSSRRWPARWLGVLGVLISSGVAASAPTVVVEPPAVPVGTIAIVRVDEPIDSGTFAGRSLRFFPTGRGSTALLGIDVEQSPGRFPLRVRGRRGAATAEVEVLPRVFPEERLTVSKAYTELSPRILERATRERRLLDALWFRSGGEPLWTGPFVSPSEGPAGSAFGLRRFFNGKPRSPHAGIDYRAAQGSPVVAANRGRVVLARELFFTGNTVVLDHGMGLFTLYVHLSRVDAEPGRVVEKGSEIGRVGATGRATGPHLHFAARIGEARVDPATLLGRPLE